MNVRPPQDLIFFVRKKHKKINVSRSGKRNLVIADQGRGTTTHHAELVVGFRVDVGDAGGLCNEFMFILFILFASVSRSDRKKGRKKERNDETDLLKGNPPANEDDETIRGWNGAFRSKYGHIVSRLSFKKHENDDTAASNEVNPPSPRLRPSRRPSEHGRELGLGNAAGLQIEENAVQKRFVLGEDVLDHVPSAHLGEALRYRLRVMSVSSFVRVFWRKKKSCKKCIPWRETRRWWIGRRSLFIIHHELGCCCCCDERERGFRGFFFL